MSQARRQAGADIYPHALTGSPGASHPLPGRRHRGHLQLLLPGAGQKSGSGHSCPDFILPMEGSRPGASGRRILEALIVVALAASPVIDKGVEGVDGGFSQKVRLQIAGVLSIRTVLKAGREMTGIVNGKNSWFHKHLGGYFPEMQRSGPGLRRMRMHFW